MKGNLVKSSLDLIFFFKGNWFGHSDPIRGRERRAFFFPPFLPIQYDTLHHWSQPRLDRASASHLFPLPTSLISLSLTSYPSLALSLSISLSLNVSHGPRPIYALPHSNHDTRDMRSFRRCRNVGIQLHSLRRAVISSDRGVWIGCEEISLIHHLWHVLVATLGSNKFHSMPQS